MPSQLLFANTAMRLTIFWAVTECQAGSRDRAIYGWAFNTGACWTVVACASIKPNTELLHRLGAARLCWGSTCQQASLKEALPGILGTLVSGTCAEPAAGSSAADTSATTHDLQLSVAIDSRSCRGAASSYKVACSLRGQPVRLASCQLVHLATALPSPVHYCLPGRLASHQPVTPLTKALALCNCCSWLSSQLQPRGGAPQHQLGPTPPLHALCAASGLKALIRSSLQWPGLSLSTRFGGFQIVLARPHPLMSKSPAAFSKALSGCCRCWCGGVAGPKFGHQGGQCSSAPRPVCICGKPYSAGCWHMQWSPPVVAQPTAMCVGDCLSCLAGAVCYCRHSALAHGRACW